jgi:hypothetical protein
LLFPFCPQAKFLFQDYAYTGEYPKIDGDNVIEMYQAAHQFLLLELQRPCEAIIEGNTPLKKY